MKPSTAETDAAIDKLVADGVVTRRGDEVFLTEKAWRTMTTLPEPKDKKK